MILEPACHSSNSLCPEISGMAGDHGNVHVVDSKRAWDSKIDEAQSTGKVVSVF